MLHKKLFLLVIFSLIVIGCDGRKSEPDASSYTSQSEILDMQEEEYSEDFDLEGRDLEDSDLEEGDLQREEEEVDEFEQQEEIDNTSSEADDTIY